MKHSIEILFSDRCPYVRLAIQRVLSILRRKRPDQDVEVKLVHVESLSDAMRRRFSGSPTILVDGRDVGQRSALGGFGLVRCACDLDGSVDEVPPESWIARALGIDECGNPA